MQLELLLLLVQMIKEQEVQILYQVFPRLIRKENHLMFLSMDSFLFQVQKTKEQQVLEIM